MIRPVAIAVMLLWLAGSVQAQSLVTIEVRDGATDRPLPNAEVLLSRRRPVGLTNSSGERRLPWEPGTKLRLLIRQIGFAPLDTTLVEHPGTARVVLRLRPMAYLLPDIVAQKEGCPPPVTDQIGRRTAAVLEQLQIGAGHVEAYMKQYSWDVKQMRLTWSPRDKDLFNGTEKRTEWLNSSEWGQSYDIGKILTFRSRRDWSTIPIFVGMLASEEFINTHCFTALSASPSDSLPTMRIAFTPLSTITTPDWSGVATLDSATAELLRIDFRMTGLGKSRLVARLEGVTTFIRVSPYVMMPLQTTANWWYRKPKGREWPLPDGMQIVRALELRWKGDLPPETGLVTYLPLATLSATSAEPPPPSSP